MTTQRHKVAPPSHTHTYIHTLTRRETVLHGLCEMLRVWGHWDIVVCKECVFLMVPSLLHIANMLTETAYSFFLSGQSYKWILIRNEWYRIRSPLVSTLFLAWRLKEKTSDQITGVIFCGCMSCNLARLNRTLFFSIRNTQEFNRGGCNQSTQGSQ